MSSPVMTVIAAAAPETGSLRRETEVTSISISCSMLRPFSRDDWATWSSWSGYAGGAARQRHRTIGTPAIMGCFNASSLRFKTAPRKPAKYKPGERPPSCRASRRLFHSEAATAAASSAAITASETSEGIL